MGINSVSFKPELRQNDIKEKERQQASRYVSSPESGASSVFKPLKNEKTITISADRQQTKKVTQSDEFTIKKLNYNYELINNVKKEAGAATLASADIELQELQIQIVQKEVERDNLSEEIAKFEGHKPSPQITSKEQLKQAKETFYKLGNQIKQLNKVKNAYNKIMSADMGNDPGTCERLLRDIDSEKCKSMHELCTRTIEKKKTALIAAQQKELKEQKKARAREIENFTKIKRPNDKQMEEIQKLHLTVISEMMSMEKGLTNKDGKIIDENEKNISPELKAQILEYKEKEQQSEKLCDILVTEKIARENDQKEIVNFIENKTIYKERGKFQNLLETLQRYENKGFENVDKEQIKTAIQKVSKILETGCLTKTNNQSSSWGAAMLELQEDNDDDDVFKKLQKVSDSGIMDMIKTGAFDCKFVHHYLSPNQGLAGILTNWGSYDNKAISYIVKRVAEIKQRAGKDLTVQEKRTLNVNNEQDHNLNGKTLFNSEEDLRSYFKTTYQKLINDRNFKCGA